jgi:hypothetical protein
VHLQDDDKWYGFAGGDVLKRKKFDAGRAYIVLTSQSVYWAVTALQSFAAQFGRARLFCVTRVDGLPVDLVPFYVMEQNANAAEVAELAWIRARPEGVHHKHRLSLRLDFSDRFLAKLSLGIGHNILGDQYISSPYANELRKLLWFRQASGAEAPKVLGTNFWQEAQLAPVSKFTAWPGAWVLILLGLREAFALNLITPGGRGMTMSISDDPSFWSDPSLADYHTGQVFLAVPERDKFVGPIPLPTYLAHHLGNIVDPQLAALAALRGDLTNLPKAR